MRVVFIGGIDVNRSDGAGCFRLLSLAATVTMKPPAAPLDYALYRGARRSMPLWLTSIVDITAHFINGRGRSADFGITITRCRSWPVKAGSVADHRQRADFYDGWHCRRHMLRRLRCRLTSALTDKPPISRRSFTWSAIVTGRPREAGVVSQ